ncbi:MAG TPA: hypothetical protein VJV79_14825 [Polyangiaceae bacterium]|nr:hypothetical protein [Polyangiaceae bacterium]
MFKTVEFRYLRVITNHLSGDRVTVGMAHWDGSASLRCHRFRRAGGALFLF